MLRSAEGYVSGQQLCNQLKVSRTAVWKVIEQLKAEGYDIEAVHGKGYHLVSLPEKEDAAGSGSHRKVPGFI